MTPLESLVAAGTKLWLDSVDPQLVAENRALGATGATSNPIIIADLIQTGRFDGLLSEMLSASDDDEVVAWQLTDRLVQTAEEVFRSVHDETNGNDGYVSFELDPLLEDVDCDLTANERTQSYIELGKRWSQGHSNRMIKVPATPGGLGALEELSAAGVTINVTLIFSLRQYREARDAIWRGAQRRSSLDTFKSVYSVFISRIDVYTKTRLPTLSEQAQGMVGILNAKRLWQENQQFWTDKNLPLDQEIIFASTGTKDPKDPPDKYVAALAGSDIQTNPPATNDAIQRMDHKLFTRTVDNFPSEQVVNEIDREVDFELMERTLMEEGLKKFADPQKALLELITSKRQSLVSSSQ